RFDQLAPLIVYIEVSLLVPVRRVDILATCVRFGSLADICSAKRHVRFGPKSDIKCDIWNIRFGQIVEMRVLQALQDRRPPKWLRRYSQPSAVCPLYESVRTTDRKGC